MNNIINTLKVNKIYKLSSACSFVRSLLILSFWMLASVTFAQPPIQGDGYVQLKYPNGAIASEGSVTNGKPDGFWKNYYENGKIKSQGNRKDFLLDGIWKFYDDKGVLESEITYQNDKRNGYTWIYQEGKLFEKTVYLQGLKDGESLNFHPNGAIKSKLVYRSDLKEGDAFEYADDGRIITIMRYNKDVLVSRDEINRKNQSGLRTGKWVEFHNNGLPKLVGPYLQDKKNGIFKEYDEEGKLLNVFLFEDDVLASSSKEVDVLEERKTYYPGARIKSIATYRDEKLQGFLRQFDENGMLTSCTRYDKGLKISEGVIDSLGREQGDWKYFYETGELKAQGRFKDGKKIEQWKYYHQNGQMEQEGAYINGVPDGIWVWHHANGKLHRTEQYKNGKEDGDCAEYDELGYQISGGKYTEGKKTGKWFLYVGDYLEEGKYRNGLKEGKWLGYYDEERKQLRFEGNYKEGFENGPQIYYTLDGRIKEQRFYRAGTPNGKWIFNNDDGTPFTVTEYVNGEVTKINGVPFKLKAIK